MDPILYSALAQHQTEILDGLIKKYNYSSALKYELNPRNLSIVRFSTRNIYDIRFNLTDIKSAKLIIQKYDDETYIELRFGPFNDDFLFILSQTSNYFSFYQQSSSRSESRNFFGLKLSMNDILFIFQKLSNHIDLDMSTFNDYYHLGSRTINEKCLSESLDMLKLFSGSSKLLANADISKRLKKLKLMTSQDLKIINNKHSELCLIFSGQIVIMQLPSKLFYSKNSKNVKLSHHGEQICIKNKESEMKCRIFPCQNQSNIFKVSCDEKTFILHINDLKWFLDSLSHTSNLFSFIKEKVLLIYNKILM